jgi:hypothetical protein
MDVPGDLLENMTAEFTIGAVQYADGDWPGIGNTNHGHRVDDWLDRDRAIMSIKRGSQTASCRHGWCGAVDRSHSSARHDRRGRRSVAGRADPSCPSTLTRFDCVSCRPTNESETADALAWVGS